MQGPSPKVYWISSMACAAGLLLATVAAFLCRRSVMPHRISSPGSDRLRAAHQSELAEEVLDVGAAEHQFLQLLVY